MNTYLRLAGTLALLLAAPAHANTTPWGRAGF